MTKSISDIEELISQGYIPNSTERKKAVLMYFFVGIILVLGGGKVNKYEIFHLKQAMGWWMIFFFVFIVSIALFFVPYIRILPVFFFLILLIIWAVFVKQAWKGEYVFHTNQKIFMPIIYGVGGWVIDMFELNEENEEIKDN